ncbi:MAG: PAS domain S-box protein [Myxococcales bacterium]|nr:PAS domain S-box protein [Myxococcales bacterium]
MPAETRRVGLDRATRSGWMLPAAAFVLIAGLSLGGALQIRAERDRQVGLETEVVADQVARRIQAAIDERFATVAHLAVDHHHAGHAESSEEVHRAQAQAFLDRLPGVQALNWIDASGRISVVVPHEGNQPALGQRIADHPDPDVRAALARARASGTPSRTPADIRFFQGGTGFAIYHPVSSAQGELVGFVNGVFRVHDLIEACLPERRLRERFRFSITETDGAVAHARGEGDAEAWAPVVDVSIPVLDRPWLLRIGPKPAYVAGMASRLPWLLALCGVGVAGWLASLLRSALVRQEALRRSEEQVRLLLDSTAEGIYGLDREGRCTFANPSGVALLGYARPEELLGAKMHERIHHSRPDGRSLPESECHILRALRDGTDAHVDSECFWRKDGSSIAVEYRAVPLRQDGRLAGAVVTFADVTARRRAEESQRRLTTILESTPDLVGICDAQGRSIYLNQPGRRLLGMGADEPLPEWFSDIHPHEETRRLIRGPIPTTREKGSWAGESVLLARDGSEIPVSQIMTAHRDESGAVAYFSTIVRDLRPWRAAEAERELLEAGFQQAQKMESLGVLAGGVAHDFNNLLVGVLGNASLALGELPEDSPLRARLSAIETSAERASELTQQLLTYAGRGQFQPKAVDLVALVREMVSLIEASISKRIHLDCDFPAEAPAISGDPTQLRQVAMNLITNAAEAIGEGHGTVSVRVGSGEIVPADQAGLLVGDECPPGAYAWLEVADDGAGMEEGTLGRIFDPFFTTKFSGRGLGLSAVRGIVSTHRGLLAVRTTPGAGTAFRVFLPVRDAAEELLSSPPPVARRSPRSPTPSGLRVLVVDDEPSVRRVAQAALARAGFAPDSAASGEAAIALIEQDPAAIDAVLLDLTMPGLGGLETFERLREIRPDLPIVLTSGYDDSRTGDRFQHAKRACFLQKPFQLDALIGALQQVLDA